MRGNSFEIQAARGGEPKTHFFCMSLLNHSKSSAGYRRALPR